MPDVQVRIDPENNEILVKGKTVMSGYYNKPAENEKAFTEDGYFRTGDAGRMEGNTLFFTERIKDLYKTSNGKYIAPQAIEMVMSSDQYIEQVAVIGDQRKFVSALIVPAYPLLEKYAEEKGIKAYISLEEHMACGVGACLGCVVKTKEVDHHSHVHNARICTDGPVFDAKEVEI